MALFTALLAAAPAIAAGPDEGAYEAPSYQPVEKTLPADMPALEILAGFGQVAVTRDAQATKTRLVATPGSWDEDCELRFEGDRDRAVVSVVNHAGRSLRNCKTDFELALAGETELSVEAERATVTLAGTTSPVAVDLKRGRIELLDALGPLDLYVGTGSVRGSTRSQDVSAYVSLGRIELEELVSPLEAEVGVGRVALTYSAVPAGRVWARSGVGRVSVDFPYGSWLDTTLDPGVGRVKSQIPFSADAYTHLEASTRVGNIEIGTVLDLPGADLATSVTEPDLEEPSEGMSRAERVRSEQ